MAPNGSTVTLTGSGSFNAGPDNTATGGGTYTIMDASGTTVASGAWTVTGILGFVSYGCGVLAGTPIAPNDCGGQAKFQVILAGAGDGVLTVSCLVGSPPGGKDEGITLILSHGLNFTQSTSGQTDYIAS
jgi:hypothetical protein